MQLWIFKNIHLIIFFILIHQPVKLRNYLTNADMVKTILLTYLRLGCLAIWEWWHWHKAHAHTLLRWIYYSSYRKRAFLSPAILTRINLIRKSYMIKSIILSIFSGSPWFFTFHFCPKSSQRIKIYALCIATDI